MLNKSDIKFICIHASDSSKDQTEFAQVNFWHKQNGWHSERSGVSIGYHAFMNGKGIITEGRRAYGSLVEQGAAQKGLNWCSIGICIALKKGETPNPAQVTSLKKYLKQKMKEYSIPVESKDSKGNVIAGIIGHRDVAKIAHDPKVATECPTDILYKILQEIKSEILKGI